MRKILFVVEGAVEYAFFSKFLELCLKAKVCKKEEVFIGAFSLWAEMLGSSVL